MRRRTATSRPSPLSARSCRIHFHKTENHFHFSTPAPPSSAAPAPPALAPPSPPPRLQPQAISETRRVGQNGMQWDRRGRHDGFCIKNNGPEPYVVMGIVCVLEGLWVLTISADRVVSERERQQRVCPAAAHTSNLKHLISLKMQQSGGGKVKSSWGGEGLVCAHRG